MDDSPRPVGFFINLDHYRHTAKWSRDSYETLFSPRGLHGYRSWLKSGQEIENLYFTEMFEAAHFVGLPAFVIKGGVAYEASLDSNGELVLGKSASPREVIAMKPEIPQENLPKVREIVRRFVKPNGKSMASATT